MKTLTHNHLPSLRIKTSEFICCVQKRVYLIILILGASVSIHAQEVIELSDYLDLRNTSTDSATVANAGRLEILLKDIQSTVYIGSTIQAQGETAPVRADVKAGSVAQLTLTDPLFSQVEIITIRLRNSADLNFVLDFAKLIGFPNLKYVYFLCEFECQIEDIQKLFLANIGITVVYQVSIAS
jgi:hypothetical protein